VGFIYVGPIGDYGWTNAHDVARRMVEQQLPVETLYVESVPEGKVEPFIDRLVGQGAKVIFTTSFGFMDGTVAAAQRYPNVVFALTEDSPTVIQESAKKNLLSFAHYSPMYTFAPKQVVSGELVHWETIYLDFLRKVLAGKYTADNLQDVDYWWLLAEKAVEVGAEPGMMINRLFVSRLKSTTVKTVEFGTLSVYDLVQRRIAQMSKNPVVFDPFAGRIQDRKGVVRVPAGHTMTVGELTSMEWAAPGVTGPWPGEP